MSPVVSRFRFAFLLLLLAGCTGSLLEPKRIEYKTASGRAVCRLWKCPPDLTSPTRDDRYAVPDTARQGDSDLLGVRRRALTAGAGAAEERGPAGGRPGAHRTFGNAALAGRCRGHRTSSGGTVKEFWQETGFLIKLDLPDAGVMETDWAENRAKIPQDFIRNVLGKVIDSVYSTAERDKFRTRLEAGKHAGDHRHLHQPSRHVRDFRHRGQGSDQVAATSG
jgi:outer membrane protein assembly factor BamC